MVYGTVQYTPLPWNHLEHEDSSTFVKSRNREIPRCVVDSIQTINGQNADKIIGLTLFRPGGGDSDTEDGDHDNSDQGGNSRPPQSPEAFYRCITEVILQAAAMRVALTLPI